MVGEEDNEVIGPQGGGERGIPELLLYSVNAISSATPPTFRADPKQMFTFICPAVLSEGKVRIINHLKENYNMAKQAVEGQCQNNGRTAFRRRGNMSLTWY